MLLNETIRLFLDSVGRSEEYSFYLKKFQSQEDPAFALICPDLDSFRQVSEAVLFDFQFLNRLELYPALILAGPGVQEMTDYCVKSGQFEMIDAGSGADPGVLSEKVRRVSSRGRSAAIYSSGHLPWDLLDKLTPAISKRIHILRMRGALQDSSETILHYCSPNIIPGLHQRDRVLGARAGALLENKTGIHFSVSSPVNFLKEIFTIKGAGTVFRRKTGIEIFRNLSEEQKKSLVLLLEKSFGKKLQRRDFLNSEAEFYIQDGFTGAAVLVRHPDGMYLNKFAVGTEARGTGGAHDLMNEIFKNHKRVFWRAKQGNSINRWYASIADGMHKEGKWVIYWKGLDYSQIENIVDHCLNLGEDFISETSVKAEESHT